MLWIRCIECKNSWQSNKSVEEERRDAADHHVEVLGMQQLYFEFWEEEER